MSAAMKVTPLKDVKPFKSGWKVHVKVLHSWKQYNPVHGDTLEMVLSVESRTYMESKGRLLPVGAWKHIQNFTLSPSTGMYRATDHPFKMSIIQNKTITRSPLINEDMFLSLVAFAITINKSQGQSLSEVGLFLPRPVFSHRTISRVTSKKGLKILIVDAEAKPQRQTMNVV
ncbi:unnamed protein product, partial [Brassica oleracea]